MAHSVRCNCLGNSACKLCHGTKFYLYEPGPRGWMPFRCPTCDRKRTVPNERGEEVPCFTCRQAGNVDPGYPPHPPGWLGALRVGWKTFFGGG